MWSICGNEHLHYSDFFLSCLICGFRALIDGLSPRRSSAWKECGQVRHCATEMLGGKRRVHVFLLRLFAPNFTIADCLTQPHSFYSEDQRGNAQKYRTANGFSVAYFYPLYFYLYALSPVHPPHVKTSSDALMITSKKWPKICLYFHIKKFLHKANSEDLERTAHAQSDQDLPCSHMAIYRFSHNALTHKWRLEITGKTYIGIKDDGQ